MQSGGKRRLQNHLARKGDELGGFVVCDPVEGSVTGSGDAALRSQ